MSKVNQMNHHASFTDNEKTLLNIIKSLQKELIECKKELSIKEAQLDEAVSQLHDLLSWGKDLVNSEMALFLSKEVQMVS